MEGFELDGRGLPRPIRGKCRVCSSWAPLRETSQMKLCYPCAESLSLHCVKNRDVLRKKKFIVEEWLARVLPQIAMQRGNWADEYRQKLVEHHIHEFRERAERALNTEKARDAYVQYHLRGKRKKRVLIPRILSPPPVG